MGLGSAATGGEGLGVAESPMQPNRNQQTSLEVYGFAIWILSFVGFGLSLLWAYLPESFLHEVGWTYYPSQYWAVALPAYLVTMIPVVLLGYVGYNLRHTNSLNDIHTMTDMYSRPLTRPVSHLELLDARMPEIADIPVHVVNRILYGRRAPRSPDEGSRGVGYPDHQEQRW